MNYSKYHHNAMSLSAIAKVSSTFKISKTASLICVVLKKNL